MLQGAYSAKLAHFFTTAVTKDHSMKTRTRVKICGITNIEDALEAINAGVDALGFNNYEKSPRYLPLSEINQIVEQLPPYVTIVGLFVNATAAFVREACHRVSFDLLQFSGDETSEFCAQFDVPYMKAIRVKSLEQLNIEVANNPESQGFLFDAHEPKLFGGTGKTFDWKMLQERERGPGVNDYSVVLAGGLTPENVGSAITTVGPYAVDVSSGVESAPGKKDPAKIKSFISAATAADRSII